MNNNFTFQEEVIREVGRKICQTVKYWKPVHLQTIECAYCGEKVYNILDHVKELHSEKLINGV